MINNACRAGMPNINQEVTHLKKKTPQFHNYTIQFLSQKDIHNQPTRILTLMATLPFDDLEFFERKKKQCFELTPTNV